MKKHTLFNLLIAFALMTSARALTDNEALNLIAGTERLTNNQALNVIANPDFWGEAAKLDIGTTPGTVAAGDATVNLTGNQTIAGNKTFTGTTVLSAQPGQNGTAGSVTATDALTVGGGDLRYRLPERTHIINWQLGSVSNANNGTSSANRGFWQFFTDSTAGSKTQTYVNVEFATASAQLNFDTRMILSINWRTLGNRAGLNKFFQMGRSVASTTNAQLDKKGFGISMTDSGVALFVHNGSSLTSASAVAIGSYNRFVIDFQPGVSCRLFGVTATGAPVLMSTISTGLPSGLGTSGDTQLEFLKYDTGSGGGYNWDLISTTTLHFP